MNIRVDLTTPINDGTEVVFRSPVDCSQVTGLIVYYPENGVTTSKEFAFADAHGNNVGDIDHLFAENVVVKVILDVTTSMAFVQNADTNAYLEGRFKDIDDKQHQIDDDLRDIHSFNVSVRGQSFTDEQKRQARANIDAVSQAELIATERNLEELEARVDQLQENSVLTTEQTLTPEQQAQARANIGAAAVGEGGGSTISYFGVPYSNAAKIIDISASGDGSVKLYLFATDNGYDAVVAGNGAIADYTEDNRPYDAEKITRLHIEKGITSIGDYFMNGAYNLKCLTFEDSTAVAHLGARAFALTQISGEYDFSGLTDTKLDRVFFTCRKLEGLTLNGKISEIAEKSFAVCPNLRYVRNVDDGDTACTIGEAAFWYCTSLEMVDVSPANTTLGNYVFLLTPTDVKAGESQMNLADAEWSSKGFLCFAQNEWTAEQLTAIHSVTGDSTQFPIPEADNQSAEFYKTWGAFWGIDNNWKDRLPGYGQCVHFSLFHIYNVLHPNAPYDTYYDFITREIEPKKIKVTQSLYDALHNSEVWEDLVALNEQYGTGVTYELGEEISATDLPVYLNYKDEEFGQYEEGTAFWGICEVLGWSANEIGFTDGVQSGADVKRIILDNLSNSKPTVMFIVGAGNYGHAAHSVSVIGYDSETDRLLIVDSADGFPADTIPLAYWCKFETLITPNEKSRIFTFDFGEVISMTDIDNKLNALLQNASFRIEKGSAYTLHTVDGGYNIKIPCSLNPKLVVFKATKATQEKMVELTRAATTSPDYPYAIIYHGVGALYEATNADDAGAYYGCYNYITKYLDAYVVASAVNSAISAPGATLKLAASAFYNGDDAEYHWTAYYWND